MIEKRRLVVRADGNSVLGMGHLVRSLELARLLKKSFRCFFVTRFLTPGVENWIKSQCDDLLLLPEGDQHFEEFLSILERNDIVVLDGYFFPSEYQKKIKKLVYKLVIIDDLVSGEYHADLIINHGPGFSPDEYSADPKTKFLLGMEYALIRGEFADQFQTAKSNKNNFFVCFGGTDSLNLCEKLSRILLEIDDVEHIHIVVGEQYLNLKSLNTLAKDHSRKISLYKDIEAGKMINVMQNCKYAVVSASTVLFEALSIGLQPFAGFYADNQRHFYDSITQSQHIFGLGDLRNIGSEGIINYITTVLHENRKLIKVDIGQKRDVIISAIEELSE